VFKYWIYRFGQFWVTHLPLPLSYWLAERVSLFQYYVSFNDQRTVKANLRVIMPGAGRVDYLARDVFCNFGKYLVEFFRMAKEVNETFIRRRVTVKNLERLADVLKGGKGAILLTAHIGNWELGGVVLSRLGYPALAVALPHKERPVNNLFNQQREEHGVQIVPMNLAVRRSLETLSRNKCVALVGDRNFTSGGETLSFLGRSVSFPPGPAMFSWRTGAPIVPIFMIREKDDRFSLFVEEPIYPPPVERNERENGRVRDLMEKYIAVIEQKVRQYPTQWLMFRKFWIDDADSPKTGGL